MEKQLKKPQISWTNENINLLKQLYPNYGTKLISEQLNISTNAVKSMARRLNIKCLKDKNLYKLQPLLEDNNYNYYWLGFIMADGYISSEGELKIMLHLQDIDHLDILAKYLNINVLIKDNYCNISCKDVINGILLKNKLNISERKTYNPPKLDFLENKDFFLSFLAGFIDGDGMIGYRNDNPYLMRIMIHGSWKNNLEYIKMRLNQYFNFSITVSTTKKGYSYLSMSSKKDILTLKKEFLKLNIPILKRKWKNNLI